MHSIPVFFVSDRYTIIICGGSLIGNEIPEREMARRGTFAPLPCASAYCQKKFQKNYEKTEKKGLDIPLNIRYDNQVRVVEAFLRADTAMNREIAPQGGNFRGSMSDNRAAEKSCMRRRSPYHGTSTGHSAGLFMSRNDTHG